MSRMNVAKSFTIGFVAVVAVGFGAACGDDDDDDDGNGNGGQATTVNVGLQEWSVNPDVASVPAGSVEFVAENTGPDDEHELVIVRTDLDAAALPTTDDGSVDEEGEGIEIIAEIEEFPVGETETLTTDLEPGSYALICNLVEDEDGETESHYQLGMRTGFTVE